MCNRYMQRSEREKNDKNVFHLPASNTAKLKLGIVFFPDRMSVLTAKWGFNE